MTYPLRGLQCALTTDASVGDDNNLGGLGAIFLQIDTKGNDRAKGHASQKFTTYKTNYTPFLLKMNGMFWVIEHFKLPKGLALLAVYRP